MCKQCLITANHDVCVLNYVNGMNSCDKKQKANVSKTANQKKHKPQVKKPKKVGSKERLASPKPSKPRICLRWSPTGRIFDLCGKIIESSDSKCKSDTSVCDDENASNPQEPTIKRFPNSTSFLGRLSKFFLGTVRFGNDHVAAILGFGDLQWGNVLITRFQRWLLINQFKTGLQSMTSGQISSGLDLTYAPSTITTQKPTEGDLDLLFEAMYDDFIGGQPSSAPRTAPAAQAPQVLQTPTATTTTADSTPTPNCNPLKIDLSNTSQDVDELEIQEHVQHQTATIADNVPNAMFDANTFVNPFATLSTSDVESSSSQYVDPSNMHTFYQPYPHEFQWTKDHPLEQVIGEPSRPVLTRNQLRSDGDMCMYALTVSTVEPKNVKEAMTDPAWIESMQEELLQFKRLDVWVLVPLSDNIKPLTLKWLFHKQA
ncbi:retrovirus-related pol polyprotein from transposon TNT 1-94 [Tanacetum coccineum]